MNFRTLPLFHLLAPLLVLTVQFAISIQRVNAQDQEKPNEEIPLPAYVLALDEDQIAKGMKMEFCISNNACADGGVEIKIDAKAGTLNKPLSAVLLIKHKEAAVTQLDLSDAYSDEIRFYQMELDETNAHQEILITSFSGGAHCCANYNVLAEYDGKLSFIHLARVDGDPHYNTYKFYKGNMRFIDNRFLYTFGSYANSPAIYRFYKLEHGKKVDISDEPQFTDFYQKEMDEYKASCEEVNNLEQCVGYAAAAARVGKFYVAWHYINTHYKKDPKRSEQYPYFCKIEPANNSPCPEDREVRFDNFPDALLYTLKEWGYVEK